MISLSSILASSGVSLKSSKTLAASSIRPLLTKYRGDSGKWNQNPQNIIIEGTAARPSIHLQPDSGATSSKNPSTIPAMNCPIVISNVLIVTSLPLILGTAISARYTGVVTDAIPIPTPTNNRPTTNEVYDVERPNNILPTPKTVAATNTACLRPRCTFRYGANDRLDTNAARTVLDTTTSCCSADKENSRRSGNIAPLTTPVSYPNKNPPSAAIPVKNCIFRATTTCRAWRSSWCC
mmetsp:Transcript_31812/g.77219  ORF Transcript_31812/g.77219 Transcript_31812/m.77219 type:complete len:237 (+) Transcript_31812:4198-4908(+)